MASALVNPDLAKEREKATFDPLKITHVLYGSPENTERRRLAFKRASDDPDFKVAERFDCMSREEVYNEAVRIGTLVKSKAAKYGYNVDGTAESGSDNSGAFYRQAAFIDTVNPFGLHSSMFVPTIQTQATEEQKAKWLPKCKTMEIIGTYAQTEMGHGTFLRGLETTATYDKNTHEFILESPTVTSSKYWPGGLGKTSNHAIVMAQLIIDGVMYGMHPFMVQLRDIESHRPMPGIEVGDINTKLGYDSMDNGFLRFRSCRIPRTNMLMKYTQVSPEGVYSRQMLPQLTYLSMVLIRSYIVLGSADDLAMACTIATRYSAVRRQTANSKGIEPQILDYQTQQMKLFPAIACAYAFFSTGHQVRSVYLTITDSVLKGDTSRLAELHNMTAGLKALSTDLCNDHIEICRRACGGHGYSNASGIPKIFARCVPGCTYEGENTVMYLQSARSLMKYFGKAQSGEELPESLQFLAESVTVLPELRRATSFNLQLYVWHTMTSSCYSSNSGVQISVQSVPPTIEAFCLTEEVKKQKVGVLSYYADVVGCDGLIAHVAGAMQNSIYSDSVDPEKAWNDHSYQLTEAAKANALYFTASMFVKSLFNPVWDRRALAAMTDVCELFLVHNILSNSGSFMQNNILTSEQIVLMSARRLELLTPFRVNAVALVDAFDYPDRMLNSCLGRYDGQVYEALMEYANSSRLNEAEVHSSFNKYIKPMQNSLKQKSKL